jgi:hypothetical protein
MSGYLVIDLLCFFGPFVAGGLLSQALIPEKVRTGLFFVGVIILSWIFEALEFSVPFRAAWIEWVCVGVGVVAETLVMSSIRLNVQREALAAEGCLRGGTIFLLPIVAFTIVGRVNQAQKMAESFDGIVSQKYSGGHGAPSIVVEQKDGSDVSMEGIDRPAWDSMVQGKSQLNKPAWNAFGLVDGKAMRVVPKAYVMFLGPFPD